jgi:Glycosyltransferase family 87
MLMPRLTRRRLQLAFLGFGLLSIGIHAWDLATPGLLDRTGRLKGSDFIQFYTYGCLARAHAWDRVYDPAAHVDVARRRIDPRLTLTDFRPNYSPIVALLMAPAATVSFLPAWALWSVISLLLYAVAVALIAGMTTRVREERLTLTLVALAFPALFIVIRYGQISALSLLLLATSGWLYSRRQPFAAGLALGALAYKPNLLVVPLLALAATREWRILWGMCVAAGLESAASLALVGWTGFATYLGVLATLATNPDLVQAVPTESHSLRGFVRLLLPSPIVLAIVSAIAVVGVTWAVYRVWQQSVDARPRWAALTLATILATPHLLTYDLLLLAVPLALVVDWYWSVDRPLNGTWWTAMILLYGAAWPGTFVARLYGIQPSTVGMALTLWLLVAYVWRPTTSTPAFASASSSINPIISS